ncbi:MAG: Crp/Fnr family transcriptional regulator [Bacteroidetes bacterium]|jgi:CRP-like cAMP-binding protein|nr:Crp/Fnr family transcriptional regulator [Bacteroidota bacterium]MDF1866236.1 Crp/Fnr family transcriptional regulator [Saprospiraceae bacterium]
MTLVSNPTTSFLSNFPLFQLLNEDEKYHLESRFEKKIKPKYSYIYLPDEPSDTIYFLAKGTIKIGTHSDDGKEVIKSLIHPTAMFGELGLIGEKKRQDFAQALKEEVTLYTLKVEDFKKLMRSNYGLCDRVMQLFGSRLLRAENKLESLIFKDARTRIIDFIKDSVIARGRRIGYEMLLKHSLTHQDIANITCTSRQTVTLVLNELRKSDLIYFNRGKILVRDMAKLA